MSTKEVQVEAVTKPVFLGEGPFWSESEEALYYVDIFQQDVHRFHPSTDHHTKLHIDGGPVTFVVPHEKSQTLIVSIGRRIAAVKWKNVEANEIAGGVQDLAEVEMNYADNRFNDAKCDSQGRLWAGTMGNTDLPDNPNPERGNLYILHNNAKISNVLDKISLSNGLAWNCETGKFYFVDSCAYSVYEYDYDPKNATLRNRKKVINYHEAGLYPAFPDGMTIDTSGNLWIASLGSGKIHCVNPSTGKIERFVEIPTTNVTSVCWGGKHHDELYVTTAKKALSEEQLKTQPFAGSVFRVKGLGISGAQSVPCKVNRSELDLF